MTRSRFDLAGRVSVVAGGTSGIGRALALGLADAGATVVVTARRGTLVNEVASEIEARGVTVNAIAPGIFQTDLNRGLLESARGHELRWRTPMRRFGEIEELVGAGIFLASDEASFITGQVLVVDGGFLASGVNQ